MPRHPPRISIVDMSNVAFFIVARNPWDRILSWYFHQLFYAADPSRIEWDCGKDHFMNISSVTTWPLPLPDGDLDAIDLDYMRSRLSIEEWRNFTNVCELNSVTNFSRLCDGTLSLSIKTVRFENLTSGFGDMLDVMGIRDAHSAAKVALRLAGSADMTLKPSKYVRRRSSRKRHYSCYFTEKTAAFVRNLYLDDVETYGYVFEDKCDDDFR